MSATIEPLVRDLVVWCAASPRSYVDALEAWRTSCPRLMVWEEAVERGLVETRVVNGGLVVHVTESGHELIAEVGTRREPRLRAPAPADPAP